jgi:DNA polymerase-3 subunit alpha
VVVVKGRVDLRDEAPKLVALDIAPPDTAALERPVSITMSAAACTEELVANLKSVLEEHPGRSPVILRLRSGERTTVLRLGDEFKIEAGNGSLTKLKLLLGADAVIA